MWVKNLPDKIDRTNILTEIKGNLYYKNTGNLFAALGNFIFGKETFIEHKAYDPVKERMLSDLIQGELGVVAGGFAIKGVSKGISLLKNASKSVQYSDDLLKAAQKLYPKKAGKIEFHHIHLNI